MSGPWLHIGRVAAVNVARRRLRVRAVPGFEDEYADREQLWLAVKAAEPVQVRVAGIRANGAEITVELTPGVSRDMAAGFRGADVMLPIALQRRAKDGFPALPALSGLRVITTADDFVGHVTETRDTPGGGVMWLQCADGTTATAPVTDAFIQAVDLDAGIMVVQGPARFLVIDADARAGKTSRTTRRRTGHED